MLIYINKSPKTIINLPNLKILIITSDIPIIVDNLE